MTRRRYDGHTSSSPYWQRAATRRRFLQTGAIAAVGGATFSLVGCGNDDDDDDGDGQSTPGSGDPTATQQGEATPGGQTNGDAGADIDEVHIAFGAEPQTVDPQQSAAGTDRFYLAQIFDNLVHVDERAEISPSLAEGYEYSPDGLELTVTLRQDVTFHNGDPFTAEDVQYTFDRAKDPDFLVNKTPMAVMSRAEVVDDYTVTFFLDSPDYLLPQTVLGGGTMYVVPKAYAESAGPEGFLDAPVGTGPFRLAERTVGSGARFERFEDYWEGRVTPFVTAEMSLVPDATSRVQMLEAGETDVAVALPPEQFARAQGLSGVSVITATGSNDTYFALPIREDIPEMPEGPTRELLRDVRVRQALNHAVDTDGIAEAVYAGLATAFDVTIEAQPWHIDRRYEYDPQKASQLLEQAGATGMELHQYMLSGSRLPGLGPLGAATASNLRDVGIDVTEHNEEFDTWLSRLYSDRSPYPEAGMSFSWASSAGSLSPLAAENKWYSASGVCWWNNPEFDALLDDVRVTADEEERVEVVRDAMNLLFDEAGGLWLVLIDDAYGLRTSVVSDWQHRYWYNTLRLRDLAGATG